MKKTTLISAALLATFSFTGTSFAQNPQSMPDHGNMQHHMSSPMQHQNMPPAAFKPAGAPPRPAFTEFPTPEELARMTPPEPMTEEKIKQHFAKRIARINETIALDRKRAEKYAKDFARYQKHQADQLAKIMAKAENQRERLLNRIKKHEQKALENFRKRNAAKNAQVK